MASFKAPARNLFKPVESQEGLKRYLLPSRYSDQPHDVESQEGLKLQLLRRLNAEGIKAVESQEGLKHEHVAGYLVDEVDVRRISRRVETGGLRRHMRTRPTLVESQEGLKHHYRGWLGRHRYGRISRRVETGRPCASRRPPPPPTPSVESQEGLKPYSHAEPKPPNNP